MLTRSVDRTRNGWWHDVDGMLPLTTVDTEAEAEALLAAHPGFMRHSGEWLSIDMARDQDVGRFMELGVELERMYLEEIRGSGLTLE